MTKAKRFILTMFFVLGILFVLTITSYAADTSYICENATYWEISENGGSGRHNTITEANPYIDKDRAVIVNGYSFLDDSGNIIDYYYDSSASADIVIPNSPAGTAHTMFHIHSLTNRLGWTSESNLNLFDSEKLSEQEEIIPEEKTPEEFAASIEKKEGSTLILVDQSGSMNAFVEEATRAFNSLDLTDVTIIVFANDFLEISAGEINDYHDIGRSTDIYSAMNEAEGYENVVLISDLADNTGTELSTFSSVKTLEIMCPNTYYPTEELSKITETWSDTDITISIIK